MTDKERLASRINELTGWITRPARVKIVTDTTDWMSIARGDVLRLGCGEFVVRGNMHEPRFGIDDQPKYWVFNCVDLSDGSEKVIKTVFHEKFYAHFGDREILCYRSPEKEGKVLQLVKGDGRFMQGYTCQDELDNNIRIIDFIKGKSFFQFIPSIEKPHLEYFWDELPVILKKLYFSFQAILHLHNNGLCHGDIRNDHILIESETGAYRWIDFDQNEDSTDFDIWSFGNLLSYAVGKGIRAFEQVMKSADISQNVKNSLVPEDGSAFYNYRIINLKKLFPYITPHLNDILLHFSLNRTGFYSSGKEFSDVLGEMLLKDFNVSVNSVMAT